MKWNIFVAHKLYLYEISYSNKNCAVYMFSTVTMPHGEVSHFSLVFLGEHTLSVRHKQDFRKKYETYKIHKTFH